MQKHETCQDDGTYCRQHIRALRIRGNGQTGSIYLIGHNKQQFELPRPRSLWRARRAAHNYNFSITVAGGTVLQTDRITHLVFFIQASISHAPLPLVVSNLFCLNPNSEAFCLHPHCAHQPHIFLLAYLSLYLTHQSYLTRRRSRRHPLYASKSLTHRCLRHPHYTWHMHTCINRRHLTPWRLWPHMHLAETC